MAKSRANKQNRRARHQATLDQQVKARISGDVEVLDTVIPHKAYGSVLVRLDDEIQERTQRFRTGLKIARDMPIYAEAVELPDIDPYVQFYRSFVDSQDEPLFTVDVAQRKAHGAYQGQVEGIAKNAVILALLYYTTFEGETPEIEEEASDEEMLESGLPPMLTRGMWSPLEVKLNHVNHMMLTDQEFAGKLTEAINVAVAKAAADGLMGDGGAEVEVDKDGFQPESTD